MKRLTALLIVVIVAALAGCVPTTEKIQATPIAQTGALPIPITNPTIVTDLQSAAYNLDQAVVIGALAADDPAPPCLHDFLQKAGIEVAAGATPPASFVPRNDGVASLGSIAYIQIQQAKAMAGRTGLTVSVSCEAIVGRIVIDGARGLAKGALAVLPIRLP